MVACTGPPLSLPHAPATREASLVKARLLSACLVFVSVKKQQEGSCAGLTAARALRSAWAAALTRSSTGARGIWGRRCRECVGRQGGHSTGWMWRAPAAVRAA